jgi:hypothetical protein
MPAVAAANPKVRWVAGILQVVLQLLMHMLSGGAKVLHHEHAGTFR